MSHHGVFAGGHVDCGGGAIGDLLWWLVFLLCRIKVLQLLFVWDDSGVIFDEDAVSFFCLLCSCPGGWGIFFYGCGGSLGSGVRGGRGSFALHFFVFEMEMSCSQRLAMAGIFCFLHVFYVVFGSGSAVWWWLLVGWSASVSCAGGSAMTMLFFAFVFCVVGRILRVLLCAGCVHAIHGAAGLATTEKAAGGGRKIDCYSFVHRRSFMYQHESKSGW